MAFCRKTRLSKRKMSTAASATQQETADSAPFVQLDESDQQNNGHAESKAQINGSSAPKALLNFLKGMFGAGMCFYHYRHKSITGNSYLYSLYGRYTCYSSCVSADWHTGWNYSLFVRGIDMYGRYACAHIHKA